MAKTRQNDSKWSERDDYESTMTTNTNTKTSISNPGSESKKTF